MPFEPGPRRRGGWHDHAGLIERLGGPARVANIVVARGAAPRLGIDAVKMWRLRGIPPRYHAVIGVVATELGEPVPAGWPIAVKEED